MSTLEAGYGFAKFDFSAGLDAFGELETLLFKSDDDGGAELKGRDLTALFGFVRLAFFKFRRDLADVERADGGHEESSPAGVKLHYFALVGYENIGMLFDITEEDRFFSAFDEL